jgi:hypothetical protein
VPTCDRDEVQFSILLPKFSVGFVVVHINMVWLNELNELTLILYLNVQDSPCGDREKNSPTVAHACRKRRLKWVLGAWGYNWATQSAGDINMET